LIISKDYTTNRGERTLDSKIKIPGHTQHTEASPAAKRFAYSSIYCLD